MELGKLRNGLVLAILLSFPALVQAGIGSGKVTDVTIRTADNIMVVRTENHYDSGCQSGWYHNFGIVYDGSETVKALYSMILSAQASGQTIRIVGKGNCLAGTGAEEIDEVNIGPWNN